MWYTCIEVWFVTDGNNKNTLEIADIFTMLDVEVFWRKTWDKWISMCVDNNHLGYCRDNKKKGGKITRQFMIWWRLMGCMVRPGWPLQECLQLCPQAAVRLPLAQPDLSALCCIFPHQYLQAVTPSQIKDPATYYCHQEIEPHCMQEAFEGRKVWQFSYGCTLKDEWRCWTRAQ